MEAAACYSSRVGIGEGGDGLTRWEPFEKSLKKYPPIAPAPPTLKPSGAALSPAGKRKLHEGGGRRDDPLRQRLQPLTEDRTS